MPAPICSFGSSRENHVDRLIEHRAKPKPLITRAAMTTCGLQAKTYPRQDAIRHTAPIQDNTYFLTLSEKAPTKGRQHREQRFIRPPIRPIRAALAPNEPENPVMIGVTAMGLEK